ncbi:hypothetical protein [Collimonas arenae]|uniref:hypothetical protein n=1 Tax=Collimonas arenae TaxID=279058 RepID=UPI00056E65E5|nr:hypothetical protein [Collimonas arenae]
MKTHVKILKKMSLIFFFVSTIAYSQSEIRIEKSHLVFLIPPKFVAKKTLTNGSGECFDIFSKDEKEFIGQFCVYSNMADVRDQGIVPYLDISESGRRDDEPKSGLVVTTGMSYYPMQEFKTKIGKGYSADVDCDTENGPVYRANSTCQVAFISLEHDNFLYGNLVEKNNVTKNKSSPKRN